MINKNYKIIIRRCYRNIDLGLDRIISSWFVIILLLLLMMIDDMICVVCAYSNIIYSSTDI